MHDDVRGGTRNWCGAWSCGVWSSGWKERDQVPSRWAAWQWQITIRGLGDLFVSRLYLAGTQEPFWELSRLAAAANTSA